MLRQRHERGPAWRRTDRRLYR